MLVNAHAKLEIALIGLLLTTSCNSGSRYGTDDAYDLADAARANSLNALSAIEDLEKRVAEVEEQARLNEANIETAFSDAEADRETANSNAEIINRALERLDRVERQFRN